jgi:hypothetical protein
MGLAHRRKSIEAQIEALRVGLRTEEEEVERFVANDEARDHQTEKERVEMAKSRKVVNLK